MAHSIHHGAGPSAQQLDTGVSRSSAVPGRDRPLLLVLIAAATGITIDRFWAVPPAVWCLLFFGSMTAAAWCWHQHSERTVALLLLGSVITVAGCWHHDRWYLYADNEIARFASCTPLPMMARVEVLDAPRHSPASKQGPSGTMARGVTSRLNVRVLAIRNGRSWQSATGRAVLIVEGPLDGRNLYRGDRVEVAALLVGVRGALNPGEPDFQGMCRSRRQQVVFFCEHSAAIRIIERAGLWSPLRQLGRFRLAAESSLDRYVGPAQSPLAAALVLGTRERLDPELVQSFFESGVLHLLAISGLHVGILAMAFWFLVRLNWLPRHRVFWLACFCIVSYALLTGARPPVMRAATLVVVYCLARGLGRPPQAWNSLAAAGLFTLILRPAALFDTGTQLSFLAVASLLAVGPRLLPVRNKDPLQQLIDRRRQMSIRLLLGTGRRVWQLLAMSAVVWLVSLPLVALRFHLAAPIGLLLNLALCIPVALAFFTAVLTVLLAPLPWLPDICGWCCHAMLSIVEVLATSAAEVSYGHFWLPGPPAWLVLLFYGGLGVRQFAPFRLPRRWWFALLSGWVLMAICSGSVAHRVWHSHARPPLRLSFVAVGHGNSVLVELPSGKVMLYDAGRMGIPRSAALPISSVLWSRRIHHIDALVLSHADADHFNAVPALLDRFSIGVVYVPPAMFQSRAPAINALQTTIADSGVPIAVVSEGIRLDAGRGVAIECLHPASESRARGRSGEDNENSVVLQITHHGHRILLTGDIEGAGLDELLAEEATRADVLLAPHHGSRNSRPKEIMSWAEPGIVVISAGANLPLESVRPAYARSGTRLFWTHRDGMIEICSDGRRVDAGGFVRTREERGVSRE